MTRLRGHHLICLHFFSGEGYDQEFVGNLKEVVQRAESEGVEICSGPDDICLRCPHLKDHLCQYAENADREIGAMDELAKNLLMVGSGMKIQWPDIREKLPKIFQEWQKTCCGDCDWKWACEKRESYRELRDRYS